MDELDRMKSDIRAVIEHARSRLIRLSHEIHAHPEIGFEEEKACGWLCDLLSAEGFYVERGKHGLPTAFEARIGSGPLHIAICAEYDCLPGVGHACGHNMIAAMAVGAAIGAANICDKLGLTIKVIGTPAEEVGNAGGKILLLERGAFQGLHAAMMVHPYPFDVVEPRIIAASMFEVEYSGKASHASSFPELGINAADGLTVAQVALALLRQHITSSDRLHGITTHAGDAPNIIPAQARAKYIIRSETLSDLERLRSRVIACFQAGQFGSGATLKIRGGDKPYAEMVHDFELAAAYKKNAEALGRSFPDLGQAAQRMAISTDMGNVSLAVPSVHPMIGINSWPAVNHQPEFADCCVTPNADRAIVDGAVAMAWTAVDVAAAPKLRDRFVQKRICPGERSP